MPLFTRVRIATNEQGHAVVTDAITGEPIDHITSLEIFETAQRRMVAVIKRVCFVEQIDVTAEADIRTEEVK